jgi:hypothetical protein
VTTVAFMTRDQNRIGESMGLLPDGDTDPPIVDDTQTTDQQRVRHRITDGFAPPHHDTAIKGN